MERVQFQQEQMLDELKDLVEKNLFTDKEAKQIMKKRTVFETALVRRVAKKADFLRYASYEMGLEQLRRKRMERIKTGPEPPSISDYALIRRQFHIFERALKKFKSDVALWIQYIQVAKREGARTLVGRITGRALQLHPNEPVLYILAASHELSHQGVSAARILLQRGIRMNGKSVEIWREYVKMELGFLESLRRRWEVLGINVDETNTIDYPNDVEGSTQESVDEDVEGVNSRREIMQGAIVKSVITNAVQAIPNAKFFEELNRVLLEYPSRPGLKQALLEHLRNLLRSTLYNDVDAIKLLASRFLTPDLKGEALVEGLRYANEEMLQRAREVNREEILQAYVGFVEEWCRSAIDINLKLYLLSSLESLIQQKRAQVSPSLLATHIMLMLRYVNEGSMGSAKILHTARRYSAQAPQSARVWVARLEAEKQLTLLNDGRNIVGKAWAEARRAVEGSPEELETVWMWGLFPEDPAKDRLKTHKVLLNESMFNAALHETILMSYVKNLHEVRTKPAGCTSDQATVWLDSVRHMASAYLTTGGVWQKIFTTLEGEEDWGSSPEWKQQVLGEVYEEWRKKDRMAATLGWARWLFAVGKGKEGSEAVVVAGRSMGEAERADLEKGWMEVVNQG